MSISPYTYQAPPATVHAIQYTGSNATDIYAAVSGGINLARVYQTLDGSGDLQIEAVIFGTFSVPVNYWVVGDLSNVNHLDVNLVAVDPVTFAAQYTAV